MVREIVSTPNAPSSPLYSQGVKAGPFLFVSGMTGSDPRGAASLDLRSKNRRDRRLGIARAFQAAGANLDNVVEVGVLLTNPVDFAGMNEEMRGGFRSNRRLVMSRSSVWTFQGCSCPFG